MNSDSTTPNPTNFYFQRTLYNQNLRDHQKIKSILFKINQDYQERRIGMRDSGNTVTEISKQLKRTYNCVNNFLKRDGDYRHGGGPAKNYQNQ